MRLLRRITTAAVDRLIARAQRTPYFHLPGYMDRYWLVPYRTQQQPGDGTGAVPFLHRPFARVLQQFDIAVRVHKIKRSDDDRAFHDHPWWYITVILRGGYTEVTPVFESGIYAGERRTFRGPGSVLFRRAGSWHRLEVPPHDHAWTLFITGSYKNKWGFLVQPKFKLYWRDYVAAKNEGKL